MADTIAAVATGGALCAIGIVRLSGDDAVGVADRVFFPASGRKMSEYADRKLVYGELRDEKGAVLDMGLCTISRGPGSYTGEDTAELQLHGSPVVLGECLRLLFRMGARQALAGEFTKRAFLNGRMDLTQAEAVIDLIHAETPEGAYLAADQLGGALLRRVEPVYGAMTDIMSHFHAVLDYPDEEIEDFQLDAYAGQLEEIRDALRSLLGSFERGRLVRSGVRCAIVGKPNVGKSSILNALLGYERAIVTDIPGTTRDTIEERIRLGGVLLRLADTAGIRETDDTVENIGVRRSYRAAEEAGLVLAVFDGSRSLSPEDEAVLQAAAGKKTIALVNKSDLSGRLDEAALRGRFDHVVRVSALDGSGFDELEELIKSLFPTGDSCGAVLTNERQAGAVSRALESVEAALDAVRGHVTPDAALCEVESAMSALGELTGRTVREDITARIFERFCVGK
ncbi:MAG: tRNA uridine-5-carboxymethylaminomethyl(34) synthesis GTPase MnmE [Candidatus Heteroscillospira sp.]|jgi:tRNA modification GTPase